MNDPSQHYSARVTQHDPDQSYPQLVELRLQWVINGHVRIRTARIDANEFFGRGGHGAPIEGVAVLNRIEQMRRAGPPPVEQKGKKNGVRKTSK